MKRLKVFLLVMGIWLLVSAKVDAIPSPSSSQNQAVEPQQHSNVTVDLTSIVVAALTLSFGYGVLKTFRGDGK